MTPEPADKPAPQPSVAPLVFEQPLNERMRTFLRLDFLYNQAVHHNGGLTQWGSRSAVSSLLDIIAITSRGDTRSEVLKEVERHLAILNDFQAKPGVDTTRLRSLVTNLLRMRSELVALGTSYLQPLKESEFLSAIRHRSAIPGGTCEFDLPDYFHWLNQPAELRAAAYTQWLELLRPLCDAIGEVLWLTRQNGRVRQEVARGGVYHITFERENPIQLMRISLPADCGIYPEISGSHYRSSVRFVNWKIGEKPRQAEGDIAFQLTCCS